MCTGARHFQVEPVGGRQPPGMCSIRAEGAVWVGAGTVIWTNHTLVLTVHFLCCQWDKRVSLAWPLVLEKAWPLLKLSTCVQS